MTAFVLYVLFALVWWMLARYAGYGKLALYDGWMGFYWDSSKQRLYFCLLPFLVMWID